MTTPNNIDLADHLRFIAFLLGKLKEQYRSQAFSRAAEYIQIHQVNLVIQDGKLQTKIPGVGESISQVIVEFVATGTSGRLNELRNKLPTEVLDRFDASVCKRKVNELLAPLTDAKMDWGYAGSIRRGLLSVKDVDVIVCTSHRQEKVFVRRILENVGLRPDVRNGEERVGVSVPIKSQGRSFTLDLNFTTSSHRGAHYLYFTGPKAYNIAQRARAKAKGLLLNQRGLYKNGILIAGATEKEIFDALGETYLEPAQRA
jgi:DNA polymerase/3'-5' exonuclease PolX